MAQQSTPRDHTDGMVYVRSLKDPVKRRFAVDYLTYIRSGRSGIAPTRGTLSLAASTAVRANLDTLG